MGSERQFLIGEPANRLSMEGEQSIGAKAPDSWVFRPWMRRGLPPQAGLWTIDADRS
jgi:hypothetical protein